MLGKQVQLIKEAVPSAARVGRSYDVSGMRIGDNEIATLSQEGNQAFMCGSAKLGRYQPEQRKIGWHETCSDKPTKCEGARVGGCMSKR